MSDAVQDHAVQDHHGADKPVPRGALLGAAALIAFSLVVVTMTRLTGMGAVHMTLPASVESRDLTFEDGKNGAVLVFDAPTHRLADTLAPGSNGFVRVVLRGMARERRSQGIGSKPPFRLTRYENGQLTLEDLSTHRVIDLAAFGAPNVASFARLMPEGSRL